jgi:DNA-binding NarL/FixJ family response regulator
VKVLIVDDHPIVRLGLRELLVRDVAGVEIGEAESGRDALAMVQAQRWDVVVLDVSMPGPDGTGLTGFEVLHELASLESAPRILMLSMHTTDEHVIRALRAGASGYITKESAPENLSTAVNRLHDGRIYVEQRLAERVAFGLSIGADEPVHHRLSPREQDVMVRLAEGQTPTEIAGALHLSVKTVSTYRTRVLEKTGLKNNIDLTRYALSHHLIQ